MFKRIAKALLYICDVVLAWGFGYFLCIYAAPIGSAYIAGGFKANATMSNLDLLILLGVSYACYAAFLVMVEVLFVRFVHRRAKALVEKACAERPGDEGKKERKLFNKISRKNLK